MTHTTNVDTEETASLSPHEARVAMYARQDPFKFATMTAAEIATVTTTSDATVARAARKLGYKGVREWKRSCAEKVDHTLGLDATLRSKLANLPHQHETSGQVLAARSVLSSSAQALLALRDSLSERSLDQAIAGVSGSERIISFGLGTGFHIAQYISLGLERIGIESRATTGSGHSMADAIARLRDTDLSIIVAPRIIIPDVEWFIDESVTRCKGVILISAEDPPKQVDKEVIHLALPSTASVTANDSVCAVAIADVLIYEMARLNPTRSLLARQAIQSLRDGINRP